MIIRIIQNERNVIVRHRVVYRANAEKCLCIFVSFYDSLCACASIVFMWIIFSRTHECLWHYATFLQIHLNVCVFGLHRHAHSLDGERIRMKNIKNRHSNNNNLRMKSSDEAMCALKVLFVIIEWQQQQYSNVVVAVLVVAVFIVITASVTIERWTNRVQINIVVTAGVCELRIYPNFIRFSRRQRPKDERKKIYTYTRFVCE